MQSGPLLGFAILSGVIGFAVYCFANAWQVWNARNGSASSNRPGFSRIAAGATLVGLFLVAAALALRAAATREGCLTAEGLFTLRAQKGVGVASLSAEGATITPGVALAQFQSPKLEAELEAVKLKKQIIEAERRIVSSEPVTVDAETARRQQELASERRHLQSSRDWLLPEVALVTREQVRDRADKVQELVRIGGEIERARTEIAQAGIRRQLHEDQKKRTEALSRDSVASIDETAQRVAEAKYSQAEVQKLERRIEDLIAEKQEIEKGLQYTQNITQAQAESLNHHIEELRKRLASLSAEEESGKAELRKQLAAAEDRRDTKLAQLNLELQQADHELKSLTETLSVPAPFGGRVAYRNPSPNTAVEGDPLIVLAAPDSFILRLRLPASEAATLQKAKSAVVELTSGIERRFAATPLRWRRLADEPSYAVAELTCTPPAEAIRDLTDGKIVNANLLWTPPLYTQPLFIAGCVLSVCGAAGMKRRRTIALADPQPAPSPTPPANPAVNAAPVASEDAPELLGVQLRQSILAGDVDPYLLSAIEWSLDRHHVRSVESLSDALGDDEDLAGRVESLLRDLREESDDSFHARLLIRLTRILGAIGGPEVQDRIYRLHERPVAIREANGNGNGNGNGHGKHAPALS